MRLGKANLISIGNNLSCIVILFVSAIQEVQEDNELRFFMLLALSDYTTMCKRVMFSFLRQHPIPQILFNTFKNCVIKENFN